jgi:hypothetical protein
MNATFDAILLGDTITSEQWGEIYSSRSKSPEKALLWAIFEDACRCYTEYREAAHQPFTRLTRAVKLWHEARRWIFCEHTNETTWSFETICGLLDLDAGLVRKRLAGGATGKIHKKTRVVKRDNILLGTATIGPKRCKKGHPPESMRVRPTRTTYSQWHRNVYYCEDCRLAKVQKVRELRQARRERIALQGTQTLSEPRFQSEAGEYGTHA